MNRSRSLMTVLLASAFCYGTATAQSSKALPNAAGIIQYWQQQILANNLPVADPTNWGLRNLTKFSQLSPERLALAQKATSLAEVEQLVQSAPIPDGAPLDLLLATQPGTVTMISAGTDQLSNPSTRLALKSNPTASPTLYSDLVFTALTPCRILDTRPSQGGAGIWTAGSTNIVHIGPYANFIPFGGSATDCGLSALATTGQIAAIMASVSTFNQAAAGYLTFFSNGAPNPAPYGVSQSYNASPVQGILSSFVVMPTDLLGVVYSAGYTSAQTDVVIDVVGYFATPKAVALDCNSTQSAAVAVPVSVWTSIDATCAAGYALTGGGYDTNEGTLGYPGVWITSIPANATTWRVWVDNQAAGARSVYAYARCCRVPGR